MGHAALLSWRRPTLTIPELFWLRYTAGYPSLVYSYGHEHQLLGSVGRRAGEHGHRVGLVRVCVRKVLAETHGFHAGIDEGHAADTGAGDGRGACDSALVGWHARMVGGFSAAVVGFRCPEDGVERLAWFCGPVHRKFMALGGEVLPVVRFQRSPMAHLVRGDVGYCHPLEVVSSRIDF